MESMTFKTLEQVHNLKQDKDYLWDVVDVLRKEIKELKQTLLIANDNEERYVHKCELLEKTIRDETYYGKEIEKKLKAENKELQKDNKMVRETMLARDKYIKELKGYLNHPSNMDHDELKLAIIDQNDDIKSLKKDNKWLADRNKEIIKKKDNEIDDWKLANELKETENEELKALANHNIDVKRRVINDRIPKDYKKEARDYFNHNPKCKGVRFHMIDFDEYEYDNNDGMNGLSGEYNGSLMAEDCVLEIDNV